MFLKRIFLIAVVSCFCLYACTQKEDSFKSSVEKRELKIIKDAPVFSGVNFDGSAFKSDVLKGKVWVGSFFFASCQGPCPMLSANLQSLKKSIADQENSALVSISVDPKHDSAAVLKEYAERFGETSPRNWYFLNMPLDSVITVSKKGFLLNANENPSLHATHFVLVDKAGKIRGYYDGLDKEKLKELHVDFSTLLKEK